MRYRDPIFFPDDLVVAISQSGETIDTLFAVKAAKAAGAKVLAICNVVDSAIPRLADGALYTHAGPEIGVASTKCFTAQLAALLLLAVYLGRRRDTLGQDKAQELLQALWETPSHMREVLGDADYMHVIAKKLVHCQDVLFLGRGLGFPIALEGALKLKEISYAHAEGYAAGEMKHGPIALIDESLPVVVIAPQDAHYEKTLSNMQEVRAREGQVIAIATKGDEAVMELAQHFVWLPRWRTTSCRSSRCCRSSSSRTTSPTSKATTSTSRATWRRRSPWSEDVSGKATRAANRRSVSLKIAEDSSVDLPSFAALPTLSRTHLDPSSLPPPHQIAHAAARGVLLGGDAREPSLDEPAREQIADRVVPLAELRAREDEAARREHADHLAHRGACVGQWIGTAWQVTRSNTPSWNGR